MTTPVRPDFLRPRSHRFALESRQLFDGAALVEAAAHAPDAHPGDAHHAPPPAEPAKAAPHAQASAQDRPPVDQAKDTSTEGASAPAPAAHEVYVIDKSVSNWQLLASDVPAGAQVILLEQDRSGVDQLAQALQGQTGITALHILSHGSSDSIVLGTDTVTADALQASADTWRQIGASLTANGDILLYGCDVSANDQQLASTMSMLTGADIASSKDATGAAARGGNWSLEASTGAIEASAFTSADYASLMAAPTVDTTSTGLRVAEPTSLNAGAERASLSGWSVTDDGSGNVNVTAVVLDPSVGTLSTASTTGVTAITGGYRFVGSTADATAWLNQLTFTAADQELGQSAATTTVRVTVTDSEATPLQASRDLAVTVTPSNDPTTLANGAQTVNEIGATVLTAASFNALDPEVTFGTQDTTQLVYAVTSTPQYGYLTLNGTRLGAGSIFTQDDVNAGRVSYVHTATGATQNATDSVSVRVNDGATPTADSAVATTTLTVAPFNQAPTVQGSGRVYEGQPANAVDSSGNPQSAVGSFIVASGSGDDADSTLRVQVTALPTDGTLYFSGQATIGGVTQTINRAITSADVQAGFEISYLDRGGLTYGNNGQRDNVDPANGYPFIDGFNVVVTDGGGGTGVRGATADTRITIDVQPVNDDPVYTGPANPSATVTAAGDGQGTYRGQYVVTLMPAMLSATDVDSANTSLTFAVTSQAGLDQGRLLLNGNLLPNGGVFTMADILAGRVQYVQTQGASAGQTDTFDFQVVDNTFGPRWNADGTSVTRIGGVYDLNGTPGTLADDQLHTYTFTLNLVPTASGNTSTLPTIANVATASSSTYAGDNGSSSRGTLVEGGSVVLQGTGYTGTQPGLSYTVDGVPPSQVVYTILGYSDGGPTGNGTLQRQNSSGTWVDLATYDTFTQQDLNDGKVRFTHDGNVEDFISSVQLSASAGVLVSNNGVLQQDAWQPTFTFYVEPLNDAPTATGSSDNVLAEGGTIAITTGQLQIGDPDDATSESSLEASATRPDGSNNYAYNNASTGPGALQLVIDTLPTGGTLQYFNGSTWVNVAQGQALDASLLTSSAATTGLRFVSDGSEVRSTGFTVHAVDRWNASSGPAQVNIQITNVNDAPVIAANPTLADPEATSHNDPLTVTEGGHAQITSAMLAAYDPDSTRQQVQFTITGAPSTGRIAISTDGGLTFRTLGVGSSFTQADVDAGRIYYLHDGSETDGKTYADSPPTDRFTFSLGDGDKEQLGNAFWIYVQPANDAPQVTAPGGPINLDSADAGRNPVAGFTVSDRDLAASAPTTTTGETDYLQVTVRLLNSNGTAFGATDYTALGGVRITVGASGATLDADKNGQGDYLVLRGTRDQIQTALNGLDVTFGSDRNATFQVQVIADDRLRDANGALVGGANGGAVNQPTTLGTGNPGAVPNTEFDWYSASVPTSGAIAGNIAAAAVTVRASSVNEAATLSGGNSASTYEDQPTLIGPGLAIVVSDPESAAFGLPVSVTLAVPQGALGIGGQGTQTSVTGASGQAVTISGDNSASLVLTGLASDIEALLRSNTQGLTYQSAANVNHDTNGAAAGDVTLTVTLDDSGSRIGGDTGAGSVSAAPAPLQIAITVDAVNDAPTVGAAGGTVALNGLTPVGGFSVADPDATDGGALASTTGEIDFMQVIVRIADQFGVPLAASSYQNGGVDAITITSNPGSGVTVDGAYDGTGSALVIRGTVAQVNAYLANLQVAIDGAALSNADTPYRVQVIADDRVRDLSSGALSGGANGGPNNNAGNGVAAVPITAVDPYAAVPTGLAQNVAVAARTVFPSSVNDPAQITVSNPARSESNTVALSGITITDSDALSGTMTATMSVPAGFTITGVGGTGGTVSALGGQSVTITGTLAQLNARINAITVSLPDAAGSATAADWNGTFRVTVVVNDGGNTGSRPTSLPGDTNDPAANPGDYDYADGSSASLVTTRTFDVTVAPVNDAPVVVGTGAATLPAVSEDLNAPAGATVSSLFASRFNDDLDTIQNGGASGIDATGGSSADSFFGIAINDSTVNAAQGSWQYSLDSGATWTNVGPRSDANALVLAATAQLRFVPAADFHGTPNQLTVRLVETDANGDSTTPVPTSGSSINIASNGGTTVYSSGIIALATSVTNVNDRPLIGNATISSGSEDQAGSASTVTTLFGGGYSDARDNQSAIAGGTNAATAFGGVAVVGNNATTGQGVWQYNTGSGWVDMPAVSDGSALLLAPNAQLRFVPAANFNGTPGTLVVRGSDQAVASGTTADIGPTAALDANQTSQWSVTHTLATSVAPRNDAPVIGGTPTNPSVTENALTGGAESIAPVFLLSAATASDVDSATTAGLTSSVLGAGSITVSFDAYVAGDVLFVNRTLPAGVTVSGGVAGPLTVTFDSDTTFAEAQAVLDALAYRSTSDNPTAFGTNTSRAYTIVLNDGNNVQGSSNAGGPTALASNALTGTLTINAVNDPPAANNDARSIAEDGTPIAGNLITGGTTGEVADTDPDDRVSDLRISAIRTGTESGTGTAGTLGSALNGAYGALVLNTDGSYTYTLDNTNPLVNALKDGQTLTETFTYTLRDPGGLTDTAQLTITIQGRTDGAPTIVPADGNGAATGQAEVHESGLPAIDPTDLDTRERTSNTIALTAPDGLQSVVVGGQTVTAAELAALGTTPIVIDTGEGTLTLTGFTASSNVGGTPTAGTLSYTYTLKAPLSQPGATESTDTVALRIVDNGGGAANGTLTVRIVDDAPTANADTASITEDGPANVSGNVVSGTPGADRIGADGAAPGGPVTGVAFGATTGTVGSALSTAYGSIVLNADGSYTYTIDNSNTAVNALKDGQTLTEVVNYTITDGDGDTATTTLTIIINGHTDGAPGVVPADGNGAATGQAEVYESALPSVDPANADTLESTTGTVAISAADGLSTLRVAGTTFTPAQLAALSTTPVTLTTAAGTLTLTGFTVDSSLNGAPTSGTLRYTYTLGGPQAQPGAAESTDTFSLQVVDYGGGIANGSLVVRIVDDTPLAAADSNSVVEDGTPTASGNVVTAGAGADRLGADGASAAGPVTGVSAGTTTGVVGSVLTTAYASIVLNADGSYTYTLDNNNATVNALKDGQSLSDVISYTITDGDGDTSTSTLTITIAGHTDAASGPTIVPVDANGASAGQVDVYERGLVDGPTGADTSEGTTGRITLEALDGIQSITVGGAAVTAAQLQALGSTPITIATPTGTLMLDGFTTTSSVGGVPTAGELSYTFTLGAQVSHPGAAESLQPVALVITDAGGVTSTGVLSVRIVDDAPQAVNDAADITEDGATSTVTGNLRANDMLGADISNGVPVTGLAFGGRPLTPGVAANLAYGTLVVGADGSYSYTLDNANAAVQHLIPGETLIERVSYTLTDADGDTSTAALTITIQGSNDGVTLDLVDGNGAGATGQATVSEHGLGDAADASEATSGRIVVGAPDGLGTIEIGGRAFTPAQLVQLASGPVSIETARGVLTLTSFDAATGTLVYSYVLTRAQDHSQGQVTDDIAIVVRDRDGDATSGTLRVLVVDDAPSARPDQNSVGATQGSTATGNVFGADGAASGDVQDRIGSDGALQPVTGVSFGGTAGRIGAALQGSYGALTLNADGSYGYAVNAANARVAALGEGQTLTEVFAYTITDADGSTSTSTLTITVRGSSQWRPLAGENIWPSDLRSPVARIAQGMDPALFVQLAVRESRELSQTVTARIASRVAGGVEDSFTAELRAVLEDDVQGMLHAEHVSRDGVAFSRGLVGDIEARLAQRGLAAPGLDESGNALFGGFGAFLGDVAGQPAQEERAPQPEAQRSTRDAGHVSLRIQVPQADSDTSVQASAAMGWDQSSVPPRSASDGRHVVHQGAPSFSARLAASASERGIGQQADASKPPVRIPVASL